MGDREIVASCGAAYAYCLSCKKKDIVIHETFLFIPKKCRSCTTRIVQTVAYCRTTYDTRPEFYPRVSDFNHIHVKGSFQQKILLCSGQCLRRSDHLKIPKKLSEKRTELREDFDFEHRS